jgi:hypothetical protein
VSITLGKGKGKGWMDKVVYREPWISPEIDEPEQSLGDLRIS